MFAALTPARWGLAWGGLIAWAHPISLAVWLLGPLPYVLAWLALFDLITASGKEITHFTAAEGANWHCEPMAPQVRGQRIFDWIDGVLQA